MLTNIYQSQYTGPQMDERFGAVPALQTAVAALQVALQAGLANRYTKEQVDAITQAITGQQYVTASTLPDASASTMGNIYLIGPDNNGYYSYYFSSYDGSSYSWIGPLGTTEISLSDYATKSELNQLGQEVGEHETIPGEESIPLGTTASGSVRYSTGANASASDKHRTGYLDISGKTTLIYTRQKVTDASPNQGLAFYNSSKEYISGQAWVGSAAEAGIERTEISVPNNAMYVRFCWLDTFADDIYLKYPTSTIVYTSGLGKQVQDMTKDVEEINENIYVDVTENQPVQTGKVYTLVVGEAPAVSNDASYKCIAITGLLSGQRITLHGYAGASYATWAKAKNGLITYASGKGVEVNTTVECDGTFDAIYINAYSSYLSTPSAAVITSLNAFEYADRMEEGLGKSFQVHKKLNILCFGNSFTQGSMGYVPAILKRLAPDVDVVVDMAVIGASPLAQHLAYFTDTEQVLTDFTYYINDQTGNYERRNNSTGNVTFSGGYTLLESVNGGKWTQISSEAKIPAILARKDWNIVTFQQRGATDGNDYDTSYAPYIYKLQNALALQMGHAVQLGWILTHGTYKITAAARLADWENVAENAQKVMEKTGSDLLLPYGTAVQNLRTTSLESLGDYSGGGLQEDEGHLQQGIGCLAAGYAIALALLKEIGYGNVGVVGDGLRPDATWLAAIGVNWNIGTGVIGISDANCVLAQIAATKAVSAPYELTDISVYEDES